MSNQSPSLPDELNQACGALARGSFVIIEDDLSSPTVSYLVKQASSVGSDDVSFMVNVGRGVLCAALTDTRARELGLALMQGGPSDGALQFTVSVEARHGVSTGISAHDRALTLRTLATTTDPEGDLVMPGHIFPVQSQPGGVLVRIGIAEAVVDLLMLASTNLVGAFCHCLDSDGNYLSEGAVRSLAEQHSFPIVTISEIVRTRMVQEPIVERVAESTIPTKSYGTFRAICFRSKNDGAEHLALVRGAIEDQPELPVLVRVQAEHRIGDLLGTGSLLHRTVIQGALREIDRANHGVFVYIRHPRRGMLVEQVEALQSGTKRRPMAIQLRELGIGAQILRSLGAHRIRLLTNSDVEIPGVKAFQLEIIERVRFSEEPREPFDIAQLPVEI